MRIIEALIFVALFPVLAGYFLSRQRRPAAFGALSALALLLSLLHLAIEGYRWQMAPAYVLVVLVCLLGLRKPPAEGTGTAWWRTAGPKAGAVFGLLICALIIFLAAGFPVFKEPGTTGPYSVGTTRFFFVDKSRQDPFAPAPHTLRELLVAAWYPADVAAAAKAEPFWPADAHVGAAVDAPDFVFSHVQLVSSHSYRDAPLARAEIRYPILIFSHGYGSTIWQNTSQMEELASHGFIVFGVAHTYESSAVPFPDGRVVRMDQARKRADKTRC